MSDYKKKPAVDAWLLNGGAEIVLEVIRRMGWTVEVVPSEQWLFIPEIVVSADRKCESIEINGGKSPYQQAVFAVAAVERHDPARTQCRKNWYYPLFSEKDEFFASALWLCYNFIDKIRLGSEATVSLIGKESQT